MKKYRISNSFLSYKIILTHNNISLQNVRLDTVFQTVYTVQTTVSIANWQNFHILNIQLPFAPWNFFFVQISVLINLEWCYVTLA